MAKPNPRSTSRVTTQAPATAAAGITARPFNHKTNNELLFKGLLCAAIGLAVLVGPAFMGASEMRGVIAQASTVGWFALVLGGALTAKALARRWKATRH
jgi:hypothetical protein